MAAGERPLGVTILGVLCIILGVISVLSGVRLVFIGPAYLGWIGHLAGVILLGLGISESIFGIGCFQAWPRAWVLGVILLGLGILLQIFYLATYVLFGGLEFGFAYPEVEAIVWIAILTCILYYLFQPATRDYFKRG